MTKISKDHLENFGKVPLSPYMSGEQPEDTAAVIQTASAGDEIKGPNDTSWTEPSVVTPKRSMNTTVLQSKRAGNSVVINDEGSDGKGSVIIVHRSGSVIQINEDGTVLIKSYGDTHNNTEGLHYQHSKGDTNMNVGGEWNVMIEGGSNNVYVKGDINIECENYNLTARGRISMNAAEAFEMQGAKFSMNAHTDNFDLAAKNVKVATSESITLLSAEDTFINSDKSIKAKAKESVYVKGIEDVHVYAEGGNIYTESSTATHMKAGTSMHVEAGLGVEVEALSLSAQTSTGIDIKGGTAVNIQSGTNLNMKAGSNAYITGSGKIDLKAGSVNADTMVYLGSGRATTASSASPTGGNTVATGSGFDLDTSFNLLDLVQLGNAFDGAKVRPVVFEAPPPRTPRTDTKEGIAKVQPRGIGGSAIDVDDPS